jgi:hypothetical protein
MSSFPPPPNSISQKAGFNCVVPETEHPLCWRPTYRTRMGRIGKGQREDRLNDQKKVRSVRADSGFDSHCKCEFHTSFWRIG